MSNIPSRDQFLFTESFDSLMNNNNVMLGGRDKPSLEMHYTKKL